MLHRKPSHALGVVEAVVLGGNMVVMFQGDVVGGGGLVGQFSSSSNSGQL